MSPQWYRQRGYLHFDIPISLNQASLIVTNPTKVREHSFYPLLSYKLKSKKIFKDKTTNKIIKKEKIRLISYASHVDSHIYSYYAYILNQKYEDFIKNHGIENNVLAFRKLGKCNIDFANDAFNEISNKKFCSAVAFDITKFFDNLDHSILKKNWSKIIESNYLPDDHYNIFKSLTKFSTVNKEEVFKIFNISKKNPRRNNKRICYPKDFREIVRKKKLIKQNNTGKGIPQGSPISALLSNIYMINFDISVKQFIEDINGIYFRYCDDILCIITSIYEKKTKDFIMNQIQSISLEINKNKTKVRVFKIINGVQIATKPLQYLGFTFDGKNKLIRSAAFARFNERMRRGVIVAKRAKVKHNIIRINNHQSPVGLYKKKIYNRYSHLGKQNFIRYGLRSAIIMKSKSIKTQLKPLWRRLQDEIKK